MGDAAITAYDGEQLVSPSGIEVLLAGIRDQGGERFDAAGWHYLESLARRAAAHEGSARRMLEAKRERAVAAFAARFGQARVAAAELMATTCQQHPQAAAELQRLFVDGDFQGLRRRHATLASRDHSAGLAALVAQLEPAFPGPTGHSQAHPPAARATAAAPLELKTVRESRATWARMSVDRQLALAKKQAPVNAGPINSHMLVVRSLAMMQSISPNYLSRIVSYVDTLLALAPREKEVPVKRKKVVATKSSKPTRARGK
ncbi:MAG: DUF2894 domain-containing protein [Massilia sp.]